MQCPVCKSHNECTDSDLHSAQFSEDILECGICNAVWSISHGTLELIKDTHMHSFLQAQTECVESDDYNDLPLKK